MKTQLFMFAAALLSAVSSYAAEVPMEATQEALRIVMLANPKVKIGYSENEVVVRLSAAIADNMTSSFDRKNKGELVVVKNSCKGRKRSTVVDCQISFDFSDRVIDSKGNYGFPKNREVFESGLYIQYSVDLETKKVVGKLNSFRSG